MKNIVLVGFMGTGKTTTGKLLSKNLGREFLEIDEMIEKREGIPIKKIFEKQGEPYFRKVEKEVIKKAAERDGTIISAGGGAMIDDKNRDNLKKNGILICLEASPDVILDRTKGKKNRPLLNVPDPRKKIEELLQERGPFYKRSDFFINTDHLTIEQIVDRIISLI